MCMYLVKRGMQAATMGGHLVITVGNGWSNSSVDSEASHVLSVFDGITEELMRGNFW